MCAQAQRLPACNCLLTKPAAAAHQLTLTNASLTPQLQVAVFGFCDIRRFTDTTEVLQEGVMEFVNVIAHLVHGAVAARGGAANKNIGDAFLLVRWRAVEDSWAQAV